MRRVVVTGVGCVTPLGNDVSSFWDRLAAGVSGVAPISSFDASALPVRMAAEVNMSVENLGARRLYTIMERVFEELSFTAPDRAGQSVTVDAAFVDQNLGELAASADLSRYVL